MKFEKIIAYLRKKDEIQSIVNKKPGRCICFNGVIISEFQPERWIGKTYEACQPRKFDMKPFQPQDIYLSNRLAYERHKNK